MQSWEGNAGWREAKGGCPQLLYGVLKSSLFSRFGLNSAAGVKGRRALVLPTAVPSSRAAGAARGAVGKLQFAYVVIFFFYIFVKYLQQKIHQIIRRE